MRHFIAASLAATVLTFAVTGGPLWAADADPTVHQIYEAAATGHLDQAQQMMDQVLRDHPQSAKAHYVQAELYAKEGQFSRARSELNRAEELEPGLPKENPQSVRALKSELGQSGGFRSAAPAPHFPWGTVVILALVVGVFWMLFRRRATYAQYPAGMPAAGMPAGGAPGTYGPGGGNVGPGGAMGGGGIGSNIAGGLAGGLAAGAGIVAGEELAHHFLDGGQRQATVLPPADDDSRHSNSDMGGTDFGVNDPGSWDDGSSGGDSGGGGGGGGDDWT